MNQLTSIAAPALATAAGNRPEIRAARRSKGAALPHDRPSAGQLTRTTQIYDRGHDEVSIDPR